MAINAFCNICGCPLSSLYLRRASSAMPGDDISRCYDDSCDCDRGRDYDALDGFDESDVYDEADLDDESGDYEANVDDVGEEGEVEEEEYHEYYCATQTGYDSSVLREEDIQWLDQVRLIGPGLGNHPAIATTEGIYMSKIGVYDSLEGLQFPDTQDPNLQPNIDGFLVHDLCLNMIATIGKTSGLGDASTVKQRVVRAMQAFSKGGMEQVIDWEDERSYGGAESYQGVEIWDAIPGNEWIVSDPMKVCMNTSYIINFAADNRIVQQRSPIWGPPNPRIRPRDPFSEFPAEVCQRIIQLLPSPTVLNLSIASPTFHAATRYLPNSFWKSRLDHHHRWLDGTQLPPKLDSFRSPLNYYAITECLKRVSETRPDGDFPDADKPHSFSLRNRRRMWNCCEAILDKARPEEGDRLEERIRNNPHSVAFVPLENTTTKQLVGIRAFYPLGEKKQFGGLLFVFSDGTQQLVGNSENHNSVNNSVNHAVVFDVASREGIEGMVCYFGVDQTKLHGIQFFTTHKRTLNLGFINNFGEPYRNPKGIDRGGQKLIGLRVSINAPLIENIGFVTVRA